jgi:hypothetical protein
MGNGKLAGKHTVAVEAEGKPTATLKAPHIILATGARARALPGIEADGKLIWTYREAMVPPAMPKSLLVIGSGAIGDLSLALLDFPDQLRVGTSVNEHVFMIFQCMFAVITPAVISGAVVTRMRYAWFMAFSALWSIFVYCPLAHWVWAPSGWLNQLGLLDFAGGTVVESSSGVSAFVLAYWLGASPKRHTVNPHNVPYILLGAAILWFGWRVFRAALEAHTLAHAHALASTHLPRLLTIDAETFFRAGSDSTPAPESPRRPTAGASWPTRTWPRAWP